MHRDAALTARLAPFALAMALLNCHGGAAGGPQPDAAVRFETADSRRCVPPPAAAPADLAIAQACAEAFVRENGWTPARASRDTTLLVREPFEVGTWDLLAEQRRYTVEPKPLLADCEMSGCIVFFRRFVRSQGCLAVTMSREYARLQFGRPPEAELVRRSAQLRCF